MTNYADQGIYRDTVEYAVTSSEKRRSGVATAAFICGIVACCLNALVVTAPLGILCGIAALALGISAWMMHKEGAAGIVLAIASFLIAFLYGLTALTVFLVDPTLL